MIIINQSVSEDADISSFTRGSNALFCYDAVWTLALALNETGTGNKSLFNCMCSIIIHPAEFDINCNYEDSQMDQLYSNIKKTDFIGETVCNKLVCVLWSSPYNTVA